MQPTKQDFAETFRRSSDDEIASLHSQRDTLTEAARNALTAEIELRGISSSQLQKLYAAKRRQGAKFDRRQKKHRQMVASFLLPLSRRRFVVVCLLLMVLIWIYTLISNRH
jgi:hypothetical protein